VARRVLLSDLPQRACASTVSKTEGKVTFYSGTTTAYPLPHPGDEPAPKPITLPAGKLHNALGIRQVSYTKGQQALALKEQTLS
jgi:hypothetical protein